MIEERVDDLPSNLSSLDDEGVRKARRWRDERISYLFRQWPDLTDIELDELKRLNGERQRLARYYGGQREARRGGRLALVQPPSPLLVDVAHASERVGSLDWDSFRDLYHPDSRRHDLTAVVAYGEFKRSGEVPSGEPVITPPASASSDTTVEEWEDEGGAVATTNGPATVSAESRDLNSYRPRRVTER